MGKTDHIFDPRSIATHNGFMTKPTFILFKIHCTTGPIRVYRPLPLQPKTVL